VTFYTKDLQTHVRKSVPYFLLPTVKENMARALLYDSSHLFQQPASNLANLTNKKNFKVNGNGMGQSKTICIYILVWIVRLY